MNKTTACLVALFAVCTALQAQPAKTEGPWIKAMGPRAVWTMSLEKPGKSEAAAAPTATPSGVQPPPDIRTVETTKYDGMSRDAVTYVDGRKSERWYFDGYDFVQELNGYISVLDVSSNDLAPHYGGYTDFPELRGVGGESFVGPAGLDGRACDYHKLKDGSEVWIDAVSKLPVVLIAKGRTYKYEFPSHAVSALQLPDAFRQRYDAYMAPARDAALYQMKR